MESFILNLLIFSIGDITLYYITNNIYCYLLPPKKIHKKLQLLSLYDWLTGNMISYLLLHFIYTQQIGKVYHDINKYNLGYTTLSPIIYFIGQDTLFYTLHRTAHSDLLYKYIHYEHHKYRKPITWVSRLSHWVDSNLENISFIAPALFIPINIYIWAICLIFTYLWANFLHDSDNKISLYFFNDNTDHSLHHYYGKKNCNFAFYFNYLDKFFGTYKLLNIK